MGTGGVPFVYVAGGAQITVYRLDEQTGALTLKSTANVGADTSFLAVNPARTHLYATNDGQGGSVSAYSITPATGGLTFENRVLSGAAGPAHLSVDKSGRWVLVAHFGGNAASVLPLLAGGRLGTAVDLEAPGARVHYINSDVANRFVFVTCRDSHHVAQFRFDASTGALTANAVPTVLTATGAGPRHLDFHPHGRFAYVINETNSTMGAYSYDPVEGRLAGVQTLSTLPRAFSGANTTADVHVHPSGRWLYGSNRGHNSIVRYALDEVGRMTLLGHTPSGGATPRSFTLTPAGDLLLVANQDSASVVAFRVDAQTGNLSSLGKVASVAEPRYVGVVVLP